MLATLPAAADIADLVQLASVVAQDAGELVRRARTGIVSVAASKTSVTDVVTHVDQESEQLLRKLLAAARPEDGIMGEEAGYQPGSSPITWVLDPIDGTTNYLYGIPHYAVSVAAVIGDPRTPGAWQPVAGCVHNPATGETWSAGAGEHGAYLNDAAVQVSDPPPLDHALVATGFSYQAWQRRRQGEVIAQLLPRVRDIRRTGSAALDLCYVASNRVDAYFEINTHAWDIAAAMLVVQQAGGQVIGLSGQPPSEAMVIAAASPLLEQLHDELVRPSPPEMELMT